MTPHPLDGNLLPADPDDGLILRASFHAPYAVPCGYCQAPRGEDCRAKGRHTYALTFHKARVKAVAGWSDREKYDAFAAVRAEYVAVRTVAEEVLRRPLTPAQQQTRDAISAVMDEADAKFRAKERAMYARCFEPWIHNEQCYCRHGKPYVHPGPPLHVVRDVTDLADVRTRKAGV